MEALRKERGWLAAAVGAAFDCQSRALDLPPWGRPPCVAKLRGNRRDPAVHLLKRMLRRGVSRFEPDPLGAIARAGRRLNSEPKAPRRRRARVIYLNQRSPRSKPAA
jgi:hypothetical protein